jgi:uncharacterized protein
MGGKRSVSGWGEFVLVIGGAFGSSIICSLYYVTSPGTYAGYTSGGIICLVAYELVFLAILGPLLRHRGWTAASFGLTARWSDMPIGVGLGLAAAAAYFGGWYLLMSVVPALAKDAAGITLVQPGISPMAAAALVAINPFYEEYFILGYAIPALMQGRSASTAINVSIAVRLLYHLYQGVNAVILIVPLGLIFTYWFVRTGRLWPVIVAHAALDAIAIFPFVRW